MKDGEKKKKKFSGWRGTCGRGACHLMNGVATRGMEGRGLLVFHAGEGDRDVLGLKGDAAGG